MTMKRTILSAAALLVSASALPFAASAVAQDAGTSADTVRDVVTVTARRREESLKDVPVAVSALSADQLDQIGAQDITTLQAITPNATVQVARGSNSTLISFIRGVGQQDPLWAYRGSARPAGHALRPQHHWRRDQVCHSPHGWRPDADGARVRRLL